MGSNAKEWREPGGEVVALLVAQVNDFERARVLVTAHDLANTANVGTTDDHRGLTDLRVDKHNESEQFRVADACSVHRT